MGVLMLPAALVAQTIAMAAHAPATSPAVPDQSEIFATVVNATGELVTGLGTGDFVVTLDGRPCPVVAARPATQPIAVMFVVDGYSEANALKVREALREAVGVFASQSLNVRVGFFFGDAGPPPPFLRVHEDRESIEAEIGRFVRSGTSAPLLETVQEATRLLAGVPESRRAILVMTSLLQSSPSGLSATEVARDLRRSTTSLWALQTSRPRSAMLQETDTLLRLVSRESGGRQHITATPAFGPLFVDLARQLAGQYALTVDLPQSGPGVLRVGVRRDRVYVFAPGWR